MPEDCMFDQSLLDSMSLITPQVNDGTMKKNLNSEIMTPIKAVKLMVEVIRQRIKAICCFY